MFDSSKQNPVKMFVGDFSQNGMIDQVLSTEKRGEYYPVALRHDMVEVIPALDEKFPTYASYAGQTVDEIFPPQQLENARTQTASILTSAIFWNSTNGMQMEQLPPRAQLSPMYGIEIRDLDDDQNPEIIMGGSLYDAKPQVGPYDASRGIVMSYIENNFETWPVNRSGLNVKGEIRDIQSIEIANEQYIMIARHDDTPGFLKFLSE